MIGASTNGQTHWSRYGAAVAVLLALVSYLNVLPNDYCDDGKVWGQRSKKVIEPGQWGAIWTTDYWSETEGDWPNRDLLYRPMAISSIRAVRELFGPAPWPQHAANMLLHALAAALVVHLAMAIGMSRGVAALAGCLFAVLPIHSEVIANVAGRSDLLATCGMLGALLSLRRALLSAARPTMLAWTALAALSAFIALASKESAITLLGVAGVLQIGCWAKCKPNEAPTPVTSGNRRTPTLLRHTFAFLGLCLATATYLALRYHALGGALHQKPTVSRVVNVLVDASPAEHVLGVIQLWGMYWAKTIWPAVLCVNYSITALRPATSLLDGRVLLGAVVIAALVAGSIATWRRGSRAIAASAICMALTFLPTSNALVLIQVSFAERLWYLPSTFAAMLLAAAIALLPDRPLHRVALVAVLLAVSARCWIRCGEWRHDGTLYASAYRDHPDAIGAKCLFGQWLVANGRPDEGITLLREALLVDPGYIDARRALGQALLREGHAAEAVEQLQVADMQAPKHRPTVEALRRAGELLADGGADGLEPLRDRADADPHDLAARLAVVRRLRELGRADEALRELDAHANGFESAAPWHHERAVTLVYLGRRDEAIDAYTRALALAPNDVGLLVEPAMLRLERRSDGDVDEAERLAERAARTAPDAPAVLACRAEVEVARGRTTIAAELYRRASRALPEGSNERRMYEERARALGG